MPEASHLVHFFEGLEFESRQSFKIAGQNCSQCEAGKAEPRIRCVGSVRRTGLEGITRRTGRRSQVSLGSMQPRTLDAPRNTVIPRFRLVGGWVQAS